MTPFIAVGLVGAAATAAYLYHRSKSLHGQVPGQMRGVVDKLEKGRTYAVMVTLAAQDGRAGHTAIGTTNPEVASANLKNFYETSGFKVLSAPVPRNSAEASDFIHKNSSIWLFNAQWTLDTEGANVLAPWVLSQTFVMLPVI